MPDRLDRPDLGGALGRRAATRSPSAPWTPSARTSCGARHRLLALLTPPFDRAAQDPGYIKGYPPGVRENGGQYTHAAVWAVMAIARLGQRRRGGRAVPHAEPDQPRRTPADVERYKVEPYVVAADVYTHPAHIGRGGWTWYTGSAGWMYRAGLESILGLRRRGATFVVEPCIPQAWPGYSIAWRFGATRYAIEVANPERRARGIARAELDGREVDPSAIPLRDDGGRHELRVVLGERVLALQES